MGLPFQALYSDPTVDVVYGRDLVIVAWRLGPNAAAVEAFGPRVEALVTATPGMCLLGVARRLTGVPDDATRGLIATYIRRVFGRVRAGAFAIEGEGFRAAATRAVVTGLLALVRPDVPVRVFGSIEEAVSWLAPYLGVKDDTPKLLAAEVRAVLT